MAVTSRPAPAPATVERQLIRPGRKVPASLKATSQKRKATPFTAPPVEPELMVIEVAAVTSISVKSPVAAVALLNGTLIGFAVVGSLPFRVFSATVSALPETEA